MRNFRVEQDKQEKGISRILFKNNEEQNGALSKKHCEKGL